MKKLMIIALMLVGLSSIQAQEYLNNTQTDNNKLYQYKYERAKKNATIGAVLAGTGVGVFLLSNVMLVSAETNPDGTLNADDPLVIISGLGLIYSFLSFNTGMPIWMVNLAKKKANRIEMERGNKYYGPKEITLGATNSGIGLIVKL